MTKNSERAEAENIERATLGNHRCAVLGTENADICPIIPCSVNDTEKYLLAVAAACIYYEKPELTSNENIATDTHAVKDLTDDDTDVDPDSTDGGRDDDGGDGWNELIELWARHCRELFASKTGFSEGSWNEISLDRQLQTW
ncbi:hypothetical protein OQA88_8534 [Cercophora sp. LCS_1]